MKDTNLKYCLFILLSVLSASCNLTRLVPENEKLLVKSRIVHEAKTKIDLSEEGDYLPRPNRQILGLVKFHLWAYQSGAKGISLGKDTGRIRRFLIKIGEPPVLVDSLRLQLSANKLSNYYFNKGFLNNQVEYKVKLRKLFNKRAKVIYHVDVGKHRTINSIEYLATSHAVDRLILQNLGKSKLKVGKRLDFVDVEEERNRLTEVMKNNGFYYFNNSYIDFSIDTNQQAYQADIVINVRDKRNHEAHIQQKIDRVVVLVGKGDNADTTEFDGLRFLQNSYVINERVLARNINFRPGELYNASKVQQSYANLLGIGLFQFVTIRFSPSAKDSSTLLDAEIILQTASRHDFIWQPQAITTEQGGGIQAVSQRNFGIGNNITLRNRNVFGNAESFNINASTTLETQLKADSIRDFSNFRQSLSAEFSIPSLLYFERSEKFRQLTNRATKFTLSYLHDRNVNYTRNVLPFNYSYGFQHKRTVYSVTPIRLSFNRSAVQQDFLNSLSAENRMYINQLLTNNLILGPILSLYWTNRSYNPRKYWSVRTNPLELSGNLVSAYFQLFTEKRGVNKEILGVKYSQYTRSDLDIAFNHIIDENNSMAYHFYSGFGLPYGNTEFLPFERRFFVGGANSLRAWRPRTIGPGSFKDPAHTISIEKSGELILQANVEYRFDIIDKYLSGALFMDAGNIWNFRRDENFENAEIDLRRFYKEFALNTGTGIRLDFSYLIFRIDWGIALYDPSQDQPKRWVIKDFPVRGWVREHSALNFAVGYPF